jgi:endonuclease G
MSFSNELIRRAVDKGLIDLAQFDLTERDIGSPLETLGNPAGYEAIVLLTGRPPMLIQNDKVVIDGIARNAMGEGTLLPTLTDAKILGVEGFIPSIGRIEFVNHAMQWGGTGWVIEGATDPSKRWIVTNRHVAKIVGQRVRDGRGVFLRSPAGALYGAKIDIGEELGSPVGAGREFKAERIVLIADDTEADCAILEVTAPSAGALAPLDLAPKRAQIGELVATIGYPAYDSRNDDAAMQHYFGKIFNVKRFAPGLITQSNVGEALMHDCTTLGGNSGSPLISLDRQAVVGLHFAGNYQVGNNAVGVETLLQLKTGRLHVVSIELAPAAETETPADRHHQASEFEGREGYEDTFLGEGLRVPVPDMEPHVLDDIASPSDGSDANQLELRYTHFGVYYSKSRKTARFTAVNMDGERSVRIKRSSPDIWYFDHRIPVELQLGQDYYPGDLDRGHLVRREDGNWGPEAQQANDDTFHYTNCALQHSTLNRGKTLWQGLENYILDSARTEGFRASVFTGPILADDDPELGRDNVLIPREFWKVVVMPKAGGGLHATAYILSQGDLIRKLLEERDARGRNGNEAPTEGFVLGAYRTFQVAIRHLEEVTGLSWPSLRGADPLEALREETVSAVTYSPLEELSDILL